MRRIVVLTVVALALLAMPVVASADTFLPLMLGRGGGATVAPTVTPVVPTPTATPHWVELVTDGSFDYGPTYWFQGSTAGLTCIIPASPYDGGYHAFMGGYLGGYDSIIQPINLPADMIQGVIHMHVLMLSQDSATVAHDTLNVWLRDTTGQKVSRLMTLDNTATRGALFESVSISLGASAGLNGYLDIEVWNDSALTTSWSIDGISFLAQVP